MDLPDPSYIWWRAQLQARCDAGRRATLTITVVQVIATVCAAVAMLAALIWLAPALWRSFSSLLPSSFASAGMAQPWLVLIASAAAIVFLMLLDDTEGLSPE